MDLYENEVKVDRWNINNKEIIKYLNRLGCKGLWRRKER